MRNKYWVSWFSLMDQWKVTKTGNERTLRYFNDKVSAINYGVEVAKNNAPSQLTIKRKDGTIEDERTYENDPYPPRG